MQDTTLDLVIIGGGPGGMGAALIAGRSLLRTVIINAESPRNAVTRASHGFLTRDGAHPDAIVAVAKEQLREYDTVAYEVGRVAKVEPVSGGGFVITHADGRAWRTPRVILATGYRDDLGRLELPGLEQVYGSGAFICPFCDGFEHAGERLAVFGGLGCERMVAMLRNWSSDVVVFTNGRALEASTSRDLAGHGVTVESDRVHRLVSDDGRLQAVELVDGRSIERDVGFIADDFSGPATSFAADLGVATRRSFLDREVFEADATGKTAVDGVYVVGDMRTGFSGLLAAANDGSDCVKHIVHTLATERWSRA